MGIVISIILTIIVIALRITAKGVDLIGVVGRGSSTPSAIIRGTTNVVSSGMKCIAFIIARIRDLVNVGIIISLLISMFIFFILTSTVGSFVTLFTTSDGSSVIWRDVSLSSTSSSSSSSSSVGKSEDSSTTSISKPDGISEDSWKSADDIGKRVVVFASNPIFNPPNGEPLHYQQGDTPKGYADCSVFVCAVLEGSLNKTFGGNNAPNGYDFAKNRKSDLQGYAFTGAMQDIVRNKLESKIGTTTTSMSLAKPGDILLNDGHVGIYVGKNESGVDVMVHASSSRPNCNTDINLSSSNKMEVGFSKIWGTYDIIRTSTLIGG